MSATVVERSWKLGSSLPDVVCTVRDKR